MIKKIGYGIFAFLCVSIGLYPLIYFIFERTFGLLGSKSLELLTDNVWNIAFYTHIFLGGLALGIGWLQFNKKLRNKRIKLHKRVGYIYLISAYLSGFASLYIGYHATGGIVAALGFICLGIVWLTTTYLAFNAIKNKQIKEHQKWMIYSYAACFAAVTLRIWLPILMALFETFNEGYRIVAWLCWMPNIIVAYFIVKRLKLN
ncbi:DUF2306 domain-containing protein [Ichthyenterobacterium sp. W332]|uniref:DUF2306 domain-containing protein n=1 Tax=Microcosmobacter mediterraneus TaxID=3075607 RepID=A0ABU2YKE8_9FLAO|nr:DUF2306 domain-containing protein [Ichthyenterobacterium sp. W332]MDT0558650.1 DUF2306 domain-containing protein [Ichthyenterobacterium sp. W332]